MDGYNFEASFKMGEAKLSWWHDRIDALWSLLVLIAIGVLSFATIVLFNGALPAIPGE